MVISNIHKGGIPPVETGALLGTVIEKILKYQASGMSLVKKEHEEEKREKLFSQFVGKRRFGMFSSRTLIKTIESVIGLKKFVTLLPNNWLA